MHVLLVEDDSLLGNAIQVGLQQRDFTVDWTQHGNKASSIIILTDDGPGIPEHLQQRVVDRFYRPQASTSTGSGLGLAIVKRIAEQHNAILEVQNVQTGGLEVRISFSGHNR